MLPEHVLAKLRHLRARIRSAYIATEDYIPFADDYLRAAADADSTLCEILDPPDAEAADPPDSIATLQGAIQHAQDAAEVMDRDRLCPYGAMHARQAAEAATRAILRIRAKRERAGS